MKSRTNTTPVVNAVEVKERTNNDDNNNKNEDKDYAETLKQHRFFLLLVLGFFIQACALGARYLTETFAMNLVTPYALRMFCVVFKLILQLAVILFIKVMTPPAFFSMAMNSIDVTSGGGMLLGEYLARTVLM